MNYFRWYLRGNSCIDPIAGWLPWVKEPLQILEPEMVVIRGVAELICNSSTSIKTRITLRTISSQNYRAFIESYLFPLWIRRRLKRGRCWTYWEWLIEPVFQLAEQDLLIPRVWIQNLRRAKKTQHELNFLNRLLQIDKVHTKQKTEQKIPEFHKP